jgi:hypothetical protein
MKTRLVLMAMLLAAVLLQCSADKSDSYSISRDGIISIEAEQSGIFLLRVVSGTEEINQSVVIL